MENRETFERKYCEAKGISLEHYHKKFVTMPCVCDNDNYIKVHWAAIFRNRDAIMTQLALYSGQDLYDMFAHCSHCEFRKEQENSNEKADKG